MATKFKSAAEAFRVILAKTPTISAKEAIAEAKKMGVKATSQSFYDTKGRMNNTKTKKTTAKKTTGKKTKNKADWIRTLLQKNPDISFEKAKATLAKKGITITGSQFYDIRRKFSGATAVVAQKKRKYRKRQTQEDIPQEAVPMTRMEWELEELRRQNQRLTAVIAALL